MIPIEKPEIIAEMVPAAGVKRTWSVRTVLRFLKQAKPGLINGVRDGYKVLFDDADKFKAKARRAMAALEPRQ